nr:hypothetical protein [Tanacetum cinerariifolium]
MMLYLKNVANFKMDYFKGMYYDDIRHIFEAKFNTNVAFLLKTKEQIEEEESRALKRLNETSAEKAAKRQKLDEEVEELKRHLQIVPNKDDDVYTEAIPLARKKNQRSVHGPAKVKGWKLLKSRGVQIITFTTTQLILLVERKYPLTRFTLDQMLNAVRLKVEEESEVSLELLSTTAYEGHLEYKVFVSRRIHDDQLTMCGDMFKDSNSYLKSRESIEERADKRRKLDKEVEELRRHLQIVPNEDDDVYTKATQLA